MDPGAWHLHSETSRNWAAQLCAEYLDETKNIWTCPDNAANHAWDCGVYLLAVVDEFGIKFLKKGKSGALKAAAFGPVRGFQVWESSVEAYERRKAEEAYCLEM